MITQYPINPKYKKENGLWILDIDAIEVSFLVQEKSIIYLPPGKIGGNHIHPRKEAFISLSQDVVLVWQDKEGNNHIEPMKPDDKLYLTIVNSHIPHLVKNQSDTTGAFLLEYADQAQHDVQPAGIDL